MKDEASRRPRGFKFASRSTGLKGSGAFDLGLVYSEVPARCAGVFTTSKVAAAPVIVSSPRARGGSCQAILINSGNANACTGDGGIKDALRCAELAARSLGIPEDLVIVSSTGVVGEPLSMEKLERHLPHLAVDLTAEGAGRVAEAMMTSDTFAKLTYREGRAGDRKYNILAMAKGAGMIRPEMGTVLAFVCTDALVEQELLEEALRRGVDRSFNSIVADGDCSPNDMAVLLANGLAGNEEILRGSAEAEEFSRRLEEVLLELAMAVLREGEEATGLVRIRVLGASDDLEAGKAARAIAASKEAKAAFCRREVDRGTIAAALAGTGVRIDPDRIDIHFGEVPVVTAGIGADRNRQKRAAQALKLPELTLTIDLHQGEGSAACYTRCEVES